MLEHTCTEEGDRVNKLTQTGALSFWGSSTLLKGTWAALWRWHLLLPAQLIKCCVQPGLEPGILHLSAQSTTDLSYHLPL